MTLIHSTVERRSRTLALIASFIVKSIQNKISLWPNLGRLLGLFIISALVVCANVCTPLTMPANGPFPAVPANGIDGVSWSVARVQWLSDATGSVPATQQQIQYTSASEWAGHPGVYSHLTAQTQQVAASNTTIQSGILSNLLPATTYHVLAQSYQGGAWCSATDQTFTTLAKPPGLIIKPQLPLAVDTTRPSMTGTHWVYGSNCGTGSSGTDYVSVTNNLQDCLNKMSAITGDDLGLPPVALGGPSAYPISQVNLHNSERSVNITCLTATSYCSVNSGQTTTAAPANGSQIILGSQIYGSVPAPINPGVVYKTMNASGANFQISYDGVTPITLASAGSTVGYLPWPVTQPKMVIHSTAAASQLPPLGVRLGADALTQYYPYMPNIEAIDPILGATGRSYIQYSPLTANLVWENIRFSVDPTVATSTSPVDPVMFKGPMQTQITNVGIVYDQVAIDPGPPPTRTVGVVMEGINSGIVNSYVNSGDAPKPHFYTTVNPSVTTNTITIPASTWSYVGPGDTKLQCSTTGGTITISGSASGSLPIWTNQNPDCSWVAELPPGITGTTTMANMTVTSALVPSVTVAGTSGATSYTYWVAAHYSNGTQIASAPVTIANGNATLSSTNYNAISLTPSATAVSYDILRSGGSLSQGKIGSVTTSGSTSPVTFNDTGFGGDYSVYQIYPTYTYTSPSGLKLTTWGALPLYTFTVASGSITDTSSSLLANFVDPGESTQSFQGAAGIQFDGWGPMKIDNNYIIGSGINGVFEADGLTLGTTPCGQSGSCLVQSVMGNLTVSRNTITIDANHWMYDSPNWDGGNRYWRNSGENKTGRYTLYDGNIIGPFSAQVGEGQCGQHEEFENQFIPIGTYPAYVNSSDWTFTNNTCWGMGATSVGTSYSFQGYVWFGYPISNFLIQNDLFLNNNGYANTAKNNAPWHSDGHVINDTTSTSCPQGQLSGWPEGENFVIDHITVIGQGGCQSYFSYYYDDFSSSTLTNSILNLVQDQGAWASVSQTGTHFISNGYLSSSCPQFGAIWTCVNNFNWGGNIILATWTNSSPPQTEFTSSQISSVQSNFTGFTANWPNANTLASREAQIGWLNPTAANFRLAANSPYISGNVRNATSPTTDGLSVGADMDQLEQHQGKVSNVRTMASTSTTATLGFYAPDSFACGVDWGTSAFYSGTGTWTRVAGAAGSSDPRVQSVSLTGLPAHGLVYYRINCAVMQPTGTIQLP